MNISSCIPNIFRNINKWKPIFYNLLRKGLKMMNKYQFEVISTEKFYLCIFV